MADRTAGCRRVPDDQANRCRARSRRAVPVNEGRSCLEPGLGQARKRGNGARRGQVDHDVGDAGIEEGRDRDGREGRSSQSERDVVDGDVLVRIGAAVPLALRIDHADRYPQQAATLDRLEVTRFHYRTDGVGAGGHICDDTTAHEDIGPQPGGE